MKKPCSFFCVPNRKSVLYSTHQSCQIWSCSGSSSKGVFKGRTPTGSEPFSVLKGHEAPKTLYCLVSLVLLLVFSVTPFKIDQNKNQNRSIDKVQNLGNERRYIYKDPRQDSGQRNLSYTRYPKKCFTQTYRDLYGDALLVLTWMSSNMADGNQQKHLLPSFATKA